KFTRMPCARARSCAPLFSRRGVAVTKSEFLAAAAGAWPIRAAPRIIGGDLRHHLGGCAALLDQLGHRLERRACVHEKQFQSGTEVVLSRLAVARQRKPV